MSDELAFYASFGPLTHIEAPELVGLRTHELDIMRVVQGVTLHQNWARLYGLDPEKLPGNRHGLANLRPAADLLDRVLELDDRPLTVARPPERRLATYCRHLSVLTTAFLRAARLPARSRCGFCPGSGDYAGRWIDHWWAERWHPQERRWVRIDTAIDSTVRAALQPDFDPNDIPTGRYLSGAEAWQLCRSGQADPQNFGIGNLWGPGFVSGNAIRDLAALNKIELLPWDLWGVMDATPLLGAGPADTLIDEIAAVVVADDWKMIRHFCQTDDRLRPPTSLASTDPSLG